MVPVLACLVVAHKPSTCASRKTSAQQETEDYESLAGMDPTVPSKSHLAKPKPQTEGCAKEHPGDSQRIMSLAALTLEALEVLSCSKSEISYSGNPHLNLHPKSSPRPGTQPRPLVRQRVGSTRSLALGRGQEQGSGPETGSVPWGPGGTGTLSHHLGHEPSTCTR